MTLCCNKINILLAMVIMLGCTPKPILYKHLTKNTMQNYTAYFDNNFAEVTITNKLIVHGKLTAKNCKFNQVELYKNANLLKSVISGSMVAHDDLFLEKVIVKQQLDIYSNLMAMDSELQNINIHNSDYIKVINSSVQDIIISMDHNVPIIITINKGSIINGDIVFVKGNGTLNIENGALVKGKITYMETKAKRA